MRLRSPFPFLVLVPFLFCACDVEAPKQPDPAQKNPVARPGPKTGPDAGTGTEPGPAPESVPRSQRFKVLKKVANGRIEEQEGLRVVHLWGTPAERGRAHGELFAEEVAKLVRAEFRYRFGRAPNVLRLMRGMLPRVVSYPEPLQVEMKALFDAVVAAGVDLSMPAFKRDIDLNDILLVNALDIFALMACSGFTVWDERVAGGGVLTCRNFDWPVSGKHMVDSCILLVQHPDRGHSHASVTWPGYVMSVTGVSEKGVAVFLHVGNGRRSNRPRRGTIPTATAARMIMEQADVDGGFDVARRLIGRTSPPSTYLTRVVLPRVPKGSTAPVRVYETDSRTVTERDEARLCVVTNHFLKARDPEDARPDSARRYQTLSESLTECFKLGDKMVSVQEAWQALGRVQRSGRGNATLHSLLFRMEPWVLEVALGKLVGARRVEGAPKNGTRYRLQREGVFPADPR